MKATEIVDFVERVGFPAAMGIAFLISLIWLVKWITGNLIAKIETNSKLIGKSLDRLKRLQTDIYRMDTLLRLMYGKNPDMTRMGRSEDEECD